MSLLEKLCMQQTDEVGLRLFASILILPFT